MGNAIDLQELLKQMCGEMSEEELAKTFYDAGRKTALAANAFLQGFADVFAAIPAAGGVELVEDGDEEPDAKTNIADCRACWCDTCGKLEDCTSSRDGAEADGIRPLPCVGCVNGLRFRPKEKKPCADYKPIAGFNNG